jgi:integrase/recombinase XerD
MTTAIRSTALATIQPVFTDPERLALAGFLAGYRGLTREAYALDLRQFTSWCRARSLNLFAVRRADIESFARDLEAKGRARTTVTRRLCTIGGFYKYAVEEELLEHSPAAHVRRPRLDYESHATALDRNELGALLVAAGLGSTREHALISLLALNARAVRGAGGIVTTIGTAGSNSAWRLRPPGGQAVAAPRYGSRGGYGPRSQCEREPIWRRPSAPGWPFLQRRIVVLAHPSSVGGPLGLAFQNTAVIPPGGQ